MNLRSFSLRHYGLRAGAVLLLFMVLSVWWTVPPEEDYSRKELRPDETRDNQPEVGDVVTSPTAGEVDVGIPHTQENRTRTTAESAEAEVQYRRGQQYL